jgi:ABC-type Mn2+/Zn2+ transport system ATPase subunit
LTRSDADAGPALIAFEDAALGYARAPVLSGVSFAIHRGDFLGLVGPNGAGKTTLLRAALGLLRPIRGRVVRAGTGLRFGYVPQRKALDDAWPLRALDVVLMGLYHRIGRLRRPRAAHRQAALDALHDVGAGAVAGRRYAALSGGQKQRVLLARALVGTPDLLLLDEPTAGMDLVSTASLLELLRDLHARRGLTIVLVTHQLEEVAGYADRIVLCGDGEVHAGDATDVLTSERLTALYASPVRVDRVDGHIVVFAAAPPAASGDD